jgi:ATP-dependent helicase/nuclease subunit B
MKPFLAQLAEHIYLNYKDSMSNVCIVLPNRRAGVFLKAHLARLLDKPIWAPQVFATEDFVAKLSKLQVLDNVQLVIRLYGSYQKVKGEEAEPFDDFLKWANMLIHDFNEVDNYLIDPEKLFGYINEARAIEVWNIGGEKPTEFQLKYLKFWESLGSIYKQFQSDLLQNGETYKGHSFRMVAENAFEFLVEHEPTEKWDQIIFAGFNAINAAEEKIISNLIENGRAEILWDADEYYYHNENQEAGLFLRKHLNKKSLRKGSEAIKWLSKNLVESPKNIHIYGIAQNAGQAKAAGHILEQMQMENYQDTALVLADENLLLPVINSLPDNLDKLNITMGYPLKNSPIFSLVDSLLSLYENAFENENNKIKASKKFYHRELLNFLNHPYLKYFGDYQHQIEFRRIRDFIIKNNRSFISPDEIFKLTENEEVKRIFSSASAADLLNILLFLNEKLVQGFMQKKESDHSINFEYLYYFTKTIKQLLSLLADTDIIGSYKTVKHIFIQLIASETLPFYGEPLNGLQLMGMLETRCLDFKNVILLSANEGFLPAGKTSSSFIPYDIKKEFGLPTYYEKDAIFAYHFYHLLQRADNIHIIYNTDPDNKGGGEKSRFLLQICQELYLVNKNVNITEKIINIPLEKQKPAIATISKNKKVTELLDKLAERGLSPSALISYINCPLDFYYRYIIGLREDEEVEELVDDSLMGTFVHKVLENIYDDFKDKKADAEKISGALKNIAPLVEEVFSSKFSKHELQFGKNFIAVKIATKYVSDFLEREIKSILESEKAGRPIFIKALEKKLEHEMELPSLKKKVKLTGFADRIEHNGFDTKIIDYKTGSVTDSELNISDLSELLTPKKNKAFQLLMYAYIYQRSEKENNMNLISGIISFRKLSGGLFNFTFNKENQISEELLDEFEKIISSLLEDIYDTEKLFEHNHNALYCAFCGK